MTVLSTLMRRLHEIRAGMESRLRESAARRRMAQELTNLGRRDLDRVLADLGCARDELAALISNGPRSKPLLDAMILRLGLEKAFAFGNTPLVRDIERRCAVCATQGVCSRWLNRGGAAGEYRLFCPNARNFDLLTAKATA